jgi:hypothetical protein
MAVRQPFKPDVKCLPGGSLGTLRFSAAGLPSRQRIQRPGQIDVAFRCLLARRQCLVDHAPGLFIIVPGDQDAGQCIQAAGYVYVLRPLNPSADGQRRATPTFRFRQIPAQEQHISQVVQGLGDLGVLRPEIVSPNSESTAELHFSPWKQAFLVKKAADERAY